MDITNLTPEQLAELKAKLDGLTDVSGRSPIKPRQLHDLRILPNATDPRPTFFWSAETPRNVGDLSRTTPYPRLMWHGETGQEITVTSASALQSKTAEGYVLDPPDAVAAVSEAEQLQELLRALPAEDQAAILAAQKKTRMKDIESRLAALTEDQLEQVLQNVDQQPARRGPGRPRKEQIA